MHITVIGSGYVGLVDGACFAETGNNVICVDINQEKIQKLNAGIIPIYEPGLDTIIKKNMEKGRLSFSTDLTKAVQASQLCFISVGTPPGEDGSADLTHVLSAAESIGRALNGYKVIVDKSTVPVGTAARVKAVIQKLTSNLLTWFPIRNFSKKAPRSVIS
jgi:UDPglucose 6-dehydrogenase